MTIELFEVNNKFLESLIEIKAKTINVIKLFEEYKKSLDDENLPFDIEDTFLFFLSNDLDDIIRISEENCLYYENIVLNLEIEKSKKDLILTFQKTIMYSILSKLDIINLYFNQVVEQLI